MPPAHQKVPCAGGVGCCDVVGWSDGRGSLSQAEQKTLSQSVSYDKATHEHEGPKHLS